MSAEFDIPVDQIKRDNQIDQVVRRLGLSQKGLRFYCPSCQSAGPSQHKSPDLAIYRETNSFFCFKCGERGDIINLVRLVLNCSFKEACAWLTGKNFAEKCGRNLSSTTNKSSYNIINPINDYGMTSAKMAQEPYGAKGPSSFIHPKSERDLEPVFLTFQQALPGSLGERYLKSRGFTLEQSQRFGLGYASPGHWPHRNRDWKYGRVVFPSYSQNGELINLYGRSCEGPNAPCPKNLRHDFLPGPKGYLGVEALSLTSTIVVEGSFDWLALRSSGYHNSVCIFGIKGFRWDWFSISKHLFLCFDSDIAGQNEFNKLAYEGVLRGKSISSISPTFFISRNCKDIADIFLRFGSFTI